MPKWGRFKNKTRGQKSHATVPLTLSLTAHLMLLISLQSYNLAPPKKKTLCKLKTILIMSWGPICNLPYLLCKYSSILQVPVLTCLTCGPTAEVP